MSEQIIRDFNLPFPIQKVKQAIEDACKASVGSYQIKGRNPSFNSYNISILKALSVLPITISLRMINESETGLELSAIPGPHLSRMPTVTTSMIEDFLNKVGDFVSDRLIMKPASAKEIELAKPKGGAILLGLLIAAVIIGVIAYFTYVKHV